MQVTWDCVDYTDHFNGKEMQQKMKMLANHDESKTEVKHNKTMLVASEYIFDINTILKWISTVTITRTFTTLTYIRFTDCCLYRTRYTHYHKVNTRI